MNKIKTMQREINQNKNTKNRPKNLKLYNNSHQKINKLIISINKKNSRHTKNKNLKITIESIIYKYKLTPYKHKFKKTIHKIIKKTSSS